MNCRIVSTHPLRPDDVWWRRARALSSANAREKKSTRKKCFAIAVVICPVGLLGLTGRSCVAGAAFVVSILSLFVGCCVCVCVGHHAGHPENAPSSTLLSSSSRTTNASTFYAAAAAADAHVIIDVGVCLSEEQRRRRRRRRRCVCQLAWSALLPPACSGWRRVMERNCPT